MHLFNANNHDIKKYDINLIRNNTIVFDKADNWNELLIKEALLIKLHKPSLNTVLKASKNDIIQKTSTSYKEFLTPFYLFSNCFTQLT